MLQQGTYKRTKFENGNIRENLKPFLKCITQYIYMAVRLTTIEVTTVPITSQGMELLYIFISQCSYDASWFMRFVFSSLCLEAGEISIM
jgi:hypothetical protein